VFQLRTITFTCAEWITSLVPLPAVAWMDRTVICGSAEVDGLPQAVKTRTTSTRKYRTSRPLGFPRRIATQTIMTARYNLAPLRDEFARWINGCMVRLLPPEYSDGGENEHS